jgi:ABC-2 type transport system ATP-binding protein
MSELAISTDGLTKHYPKVRAVDGLNLRVPRGSVYGFLGRNGAGKTTTIRMLMGLARPTTGSARILDMSWPHDGLAILQRTAFLGEKKLLFESMTGRDLVRFNRAFFPTWSEALAEKCVRRLEIPMDQPFKKASHGNRTKLCLLMALAQGAELLILDEPTSGTDPVIIDELLKLLIEGYAGDGRTIFLSSHYLAEVERLADWVGIINEGKLLLEARLDDIRMDFRRIIASGNALPSSQDAQIISAVPFGSLHEYIVRNDVDRFVADLRNQGATIVDVSSLNLSEVFLQLVHKEEPCISGNAGATPASVSSST